MRTQPLTQLLSSVFPSSTFFSTYYYLLPAPATHEAMREARLPISFRDGCAGLLIPLNTCRQATMYLPFKCGHERHEYEKCMYIEHLKAVKRKLAGEE